MRRSTTGNAARPGGRLALAFAFVGLVSAAALLACRGILGIDDDVALLPTGTDGGGSLEDGPASATDGGPSADAANDVASGFDAAFDAGATAVDRRFAVWPLPPVKPLLSKSNGAKPAGRRRRKPRAIPISRAAGLASG